MNNRLINLMLMAAVVLGLGTSVTSCKDDDNELTPEQQEQQEAEKASAFWDVVGQLVSVDDVTEDYQGKTFEPTIGLPDETNATTRIVNTNDMQTAAQRFANLVGAKDINENTSSYTWSDPDIGSMTYTRGGTAAEWATVDVDIKAVPSLQRIIYRGGGEGDNGKFSGKAYYRFGDVVSRQVTVTYDQKKNNDQRGTITEYWICVRPAFGPEGKEDSHWVCVNTVGDKNYEYYKASTGTEYWLPTSLNTNKEHMQNFAEMLWALCDSEQWEKNIKNHHTDGLLWGFDGVPFFTDFTKANIELNNENFWADVSKGWERFNIAQLALNMDNLGTVADFINRDGIHLLYKGYSWWFKTSWNCQLWEAVYTNGTKNEELNMHHAVYNEKIEHNMKDVRFDVRALGKNTENYAGFFNNDGKVRWVIRHATGKELATDKKFDVKKPIEGVTEVYRYYRDMVPTTDLALLPEITINAKNMIYLNRGYYNVGDVVTDHQGNKWFCIQPSGFQVDADLYGDLVNYAYFISFDQKAVGANLENVTSSRNLAIQMLFDMEVTYHNAQTSAAGTSAQAIKNIKAYTGIDLMELIAARDSTVRHAKDKDTSLEINDFISTLYRENGQLYVVRMIGDYTHDEPDGGRAWSWYLWTRYSKKPDRKMLLNDLADQSIVNSYNEDPWVHRSWYNPTTRQKSYANSGPRTQTEAITPLTRFIYQPGQSAMGGTAPTNMYREPLYAFAVKRVKDEGKYGTAFEDGTIFNHTRLMKETGESFIDDEETGEIVVVFGSYNAYKTFTIFLDEASYPFGMTNKS